MRLIALAFLVMVLAATVAMFAGGFFDGDNGAREAGWAWCGFDEAC